MTATNTKTRLRHTPKRRRPNCVEIRKDLDPWFYPTLESFEAALKGGTLRREFGCRTKEEGAAAARDCLAAKAKCRLCVKYPRPNAETLAAIREAKEIEGEIAAGTRTPMTLDAFLAEMERV